MSTRPRTWLRGLWRRFRWLVLVAALALAYLLLWPTPLDPYAWTPPQNPGTGPGSRFEPTQNMQKSAPLAATLVGQRYTAAGKPENFGPEDIAIGPRDGKVYAGIGDGSILRIDPATGEASVFTNTGGRPLGLAFTPEGDRLYVADAHLGLLAVDAQGHTTVVVSEVGGQPLAFADNLDVAPDGTVWFSAPTRDHTFEQVTLDVWDSRPSGRLLRYDPDTGSVDTVLDNLFYANGVEVSADGSFVLVAEFLAYRIQRYWITGPRAGSHELLIDALPGYPDNITKAPDGSFLVGLSLARVAALDAQRPKPWAVEIIYRLPSWLKPKAQFPGYLLELAEDGKVRRFIADQAPGAVAQVTAAAVLPPDGTGLDADLILGSLRVSAVRRLPVSDPR